MSIHKITVVRNTSTGYHEGLYMNGKLVKSATCISPDDVIECLGVTVKFVEYDDDWGMKNETFPEYLKDVKVDVELTKEYYGDRK
jgi:hypothetical protein